MSDVEKTKQAIACVIEWFKADPQHWTQRHYGSVGLRDKDKVVRPANVGRAELVRGGWTPNTAMASNPFEVLCTCIMGGFYMCRGSDENVEPLEGVFMREFTRRIGVHPVGFNDVPGRKVGEVIEALEKVHAAL